jgi:hypothetical protein
MSGRPQFPKEPTQRPSIGSEPDATALGVEIRPNRSRRGSDSSVRARHQIEEVMAERGLLTRARCRRIEKPGGSIAAQIGDDDVIPGAASGGATRRGCRRGIRASGRPDGRPPGCFPRTRCRGLRCGRSSWRPSLSECCRQRYAGRQCWRSYAVESAQRTETIAFPFASHSRHRSQAKSKPTLSEIKPAFADTAGLRADLRALRRAYHPAQTASTKSCPGEQGELW